jgi:hypothetical protein
VNSVSDDEMQRRLGTVRAYAAVLLKKGREYQTHDIRTPEQAKIVREHGRRNMELSDAGKMAIVGPIAGAGEIVGLCVFSVPADEVRQIMDGDGAVQANIFTYDIVTLYGFPGDTLPALADAD